MTETVVTDFYYGTGLKTLESMITTRGVKSVEEHFLYDTYGNVTRRYDANNFYTKYIYDNTYHAFVIETLRQVSNVDSMTVGKAEYYWRAGIPRWTSGPSYDTTFYTYDNYNRQTAVRLPLDATNSSYREYIPASNRVRDSVKTIGGTTPTWRVTETKYDGFNHVVSSRLKIDGGYYRDSTIYDAEGRVDTAFVTHLATEGSPDFTEYKYDILGRVVKTISPTSDADSINYINFYTTEAIDASGRRVKVSRDFAGNVITTNRYDNSSNYRDTSTSTYFPFGKRRWTTPPNGAAFKDTVGYDAFGNVTARYNPDEGVKRYYYNKLGQLRLAKDAVGTWTYFKYDGMGRITEQGVYLGNVSNPDTTAWTDNSFPTSDTSQVVRKTYDTYTPAVRDSFICAGALENPNGLLTEVYDPTGYNYFFYDARGRVLKKVTYVNGDTIRIHRYTYHPGDMVDKMYYPQYSSTTVDTTMNAIQYGYYDYGWTRGVSGYADTGSSTPGIFYEPYGAVDSIALRPSGSVSPIRVKFEHDAAGRQTKQYVANTVTSQDAAVFRRSYTFTGGDLTQVNKTDSSGNYVSIAQEYKYDALGRLDTAADHSLGSTRNYRYVYDKNGNFDTVYAFGSSHKYRYQDNCNRLQRSGWGSVQDDFVYDANGCLTYDPQKGTEGTTLSPDYRNLDTLVLQRVYGIGEDYREDTLRLFYDYTGRRVKKTAITWRYEPGEFMENRIGDEGPDPPDTLYPPVDPNWVRWESNTYYYYSGSEVSLVVRRSTGYPTFWTANIYAAGKKIATGDYYMGGTLQKRFEVSDYQGNLRNVFFYSGNTLALAEAIWYNPFGKQDSVLVGGILPHRFTYNGKELDGEFDLDRYYYGARYYDPQIGRFTSPDPINDDWTPYSYVRNNPIMNNDPTGMMTGGGSGFNPGADPCPGWESQTRDMFSSWAFEAAGKMQLPPWLFRQYLWANGGGGPTGGNDSKNWKDVIGRRAESALKSGEISQEQYDKLEAFLDNDRIAVKDLAEGVYGEYFYPGGYPYVDENSDHLVIGEVINISPKTVSLLLGKGKNAPEAGFALVIHEIGHSIALTEVAWHGKTVIDHYRGYADQAVFWLKSKSYDPTLTGGGGVLSRLNQTADVYKYNGGYNAIFRMYCNIICAGGSL